MQSHKELVAVVSLLALLSFAIGACSVLAITELFPVWTTAAKLVACLSLAIVYGLFTLKRMLSFKPQDTE